MAQEPKQIIPMPELNGTEGRAELEISTRKYSNGQIVSSAHVHFVKDGMVTFMMYGDFRKTVLRSSGRATQKTLNQQHSTVFNPDYLVLLKAEVIAFYYDKRKQDAS